MATKITKKPTAKVTSLTVPKRMDGTWGWKSTWKVPSSATDSKSNARAANVEAEWELGLGLGNKNPKLSYKFGAVAGAVACWLNAGYDWSNGFKNVTRTSFYPCTSRKLWNIHLRVRLTNEKGRGDIAYVYCATQLPRNPSVTNLEQASESGVVSSTIKFDKGWSDNREGYDCRYRLTVLDTRTSTKEVVKRDTSDTRTEFTVSFDVDDRQELAYDQYVRITLEAWVRGLRGDSGHIKRTLTVGYPAKATITGVSVPTTDPTGKVTVKIKTNSNDNHPVTSCKLQKLVGVTYTSASEIPASATWVDTDSVDNGTCTALALSVADIKPEAGLTSWVRVKTWNDVESIFSRYSEPVRVDKLESPLPTAEDEEVDILRIISGADGESAVALLGWNASGADDATGTELTWSENPNAWISTEEPNSYQFAWSDGPISWEDPDTHEITNYGDSATIHIRGLTENTLYFVRARRYLENDLGTTYSSYSDTKSILPTTTPDSVTLIVPSFVERGKSLQLSWVYGSNAPQTSWEILSGTTVVANGTDSIGSCVISADRLASLFDGDSVSIAVRMSTGGDYVTSDVQEVRIADAPSLEVSIDDIVTAQAPTIELESNAGCNVAYVILAHGLQSDYPDGTRTQVEGDTVYSEVVQPEWVEDDGTYTASFDLPDGLNFWDGAAYTLRATATNAETNLVSDPVEVDFIVNWAHQAPAPSEEIEIIPHDEVDEDGIHSRYVEIQLVAPEDAESTDVYDIYRVTPDKSYLVAVDAALTDVVIDQFAPFGKTELNYRIACRTADGDVDWMDFPYSLDGDCMRIDFGSQYVELPYNIVIGDTYTKDFESRAHLGSSTPQGYWNKTITRTASLSTVVFRLKDLDTQETIRELAQYPAACFVRLPNGCAYQANIEVNGLDWNHTSGMSPVSLDATEVGLTAEYMAAVPIPEEQPEDEEPEEV